MSTVQCINCQTPYPKQGVPYRCPVCGGLFDFLTPLSFDADKVNREMPGLWRYRHALALPDSAPIISLGEGDTPLIESEAFGQRVFFKCDYLNPSGSFKDRGSSVLASFLKSRGVTTAVEDSSGNAGASFAAYAARAGIQARIFIPDSASGPKRAQIEAYGAQVVRIMGPRSNASMAVRRAVDRATLEGEKPERGGEMAVLPGLVYASHASLPFNLPGYATLAYEVCEQLGEAPGTLLTPAGQGGLLLGVGRGFEALLRAGLSQRMPRLVGVQARACAPLWALSSYGPAGLGWVAEGETLAEGVRVSQPVRGDAVIQITAASQGKFVVVDEEEILPGRDELARRGFYVEPTSAIVWGALAQIGANTPEPIVVVLTGSAYKSRL